MSKKRKTLADELLELTNPEPAPAVDVADADAFGDGAPRLADADADVGDDDTHGGAKRSRCVRE